MTVRRVRLFVSHSSSQSPEARQRLRAFVEALRSGEDAVDVLYDQEQITSGDHWRERIHAMLAECDAATILITEDALESPWVLKEATILAWRHERNKKFALLPVLSDKVDLKRLKRNKLWNPLDIPEIQFVSKADPADASAAVQNKLVALRSALTPTPLDALASDIAHLLGTATATHCQLVWNELGENLPLEEIGHKHTTARAIARWMLQQRPPALKRIAESLVGLGKMFPYRDAMAIVKLVAPLWVELDAASQFTSVHHEHANDRDLAIWCRRPTPVLQHYVDIAHLPSAAPRVVLLNAVTGGRQVDDVVVELRAVLGERFWDNTGLGPLADDEVDDMINAIEDRVYVALPMPEDEDVITDLQRRYPLITFIYFVSNEDASPSRLPGVRWVPRPANLGLEDAVLTDLAKAHVIVKNRFR
ncbi:MAG: toll/interleukin-1 receptor domain-containing protein [Actinobacteria bacterium]|nr:toll/interleukin-1 receptor domain-containing protein [Actinomycetota bacterium]